MIVFCKFFCFWKNFLLELKMVNILNNQICICCKMENFIEFDAFTIVSY